MAADDDVFTGEPRKRDLHHGQVAQQFIDDRGGVLVADASAARPDPGVAVAPRRPKTCWRWFHDRLSAARRPRPPARRR